MYQFVRSCRFVSVDNSLHTNYLFRSNIRSSHQHPLQKQKYLSTTPSVENLTRIEAITNNNDDEVKLENVNRVTLESNNNGPFNLAESEQHQNG